MKFLVVGLGSMGKRRVRNLQALGHKDIAGFDPRADRREEGASRYGIKTFDTYNKALAEFQPDALVISTGPACTWITRNLQSDSACTASSKLRWSRENVSPSSARRLKAPGW